jgi:excisionase family DNA binding protein
MSRTGRRSPRPAPRLGMKRRLRMRNSPTAQSDWSALPSSPAPEPYADQLLRPREVAELLGVRTATVRKWAIAGRLQVTLTPGGHSRYRWADVRALLEDGAGDAEQRQLEEDATRLYQQGWSIRQVAERFECGYGTMRRILLRSTPLRSRGGLPVERRMPGE